jgi:E3 ubiquitin-protein ligase DOA10
MSRWTSFVHGVANVLAFVVAVGVFAAGLWFVVLPSTSDSVPAPVPTITHTDKTTTAPDGTKTTETTDVRTTEAQSLTERYLNKNHLGTFVLIGIVLLLAFLAGGIVQRIFRGEYAIKVGPVELPAIKEAVARTEEAVELLSKQVAITKDLTRQAIQHVADAIANKSVVAPEMGAELKALEDDTTLKQVDHQLDKARKALRDAGY